jgi:hypothetical protein
MPSYIKMLMQYGTSTAHVLTVELRENRNQHIISLARTALKGAIQSRNIDVNGYTDILNKVLYVLEQSSKHLKSLTESKRLLQQQSTTTQVQAHSSLFVSGGVICPEFDSKVVYGRALLSLENIIVDTSIPAIHISTLLHGNNVSVTCIRQQQTNYRDSKHYVVCGNVCKSLKDLNLGSRGEFRMLWPPFMSHYLRRTNTTNAHILGFSNAHLCLNNTTHNITPLFDYVKSQSNQLTCISVFV